MDKSSHCNFGKYVVTASRTFQLAFFLFFLVEAQVHYCDHALSVVRPSVRLVSVVVNFSHFRLLLKIAERNLTKLDRKQDINIPYHVCIFRVDRKNEIAALASDWLRHFRLLPLIGIQRNFKLIDRKISTSSTKFVFFGLIGKTKWPP